MINGSSVIEGTAFYCDQLMVVIGYYYPPPPPPPPLGDFLPVSACAQLVSQRVNLKRLFAMVDCIDPMWASMLCIVAMFTWRS